MKKIIIAAVAKNNVIGKEGKIPWKIPTEQRFFREKTIYNPILMGRKTFESMKLPLDKRLNLVLSRKKVGDLGNVKYFNLTIGDISCILLIYTFMLNSF